MTIGAYILIGIGVALSLLNWACLFDSMFNKRHVSPVFPAPSILTVIGLALLESTRNYWWIGLFTDYTLLLLIIAIPQMIASEWRTSRFTQIWLFLAEDGPRHIKLSVHRGGHFLLHVRFDSGASKGGVGQWEKMHDGRFRLWGYWDERVLTLERTGSDYIGQEEHYIQKNNFNDAMDGLRFRLISSSKPI